MWAWPGETSKEGTACGSASETVLVAPNVASDIVTRRDVRRSMRAKKPGDPGEEPAHRSEYDPAHDRVIVAGNVPTGGSRSEQALLTVEAMPRPKHRSKTHSRSDHQADEQDLHLPHARQARTRVCTRPGIFHPAPPPPPSAHPASSGSWPLTNGRLRPQPLAGAFGDVEDEIAVSRTARPGVDSTPLAEMFGNFGFLITGVGGRSISAHLE